MITKKLPPYKDAKDPDLTILDINRLLKQYGIQNYQWTTLWEKGEVGLRFSVETAPGKNIGIRVYAAPFFAKRKTYDAKAGKHVTREAPNWAQSLRLLYYFLKAKIEGIAYGLRTVEEEFLSDIVVRHPTTGEETTVGEMLAPALQEGGVIRPQLIGAPPKTEE